MNPFFVAVVFALALFQARDVCGQMVIDDRESATSSTYSLICKAGGQDKVLWTKVIAKINGQKPYDWCRLIASDQNAQGSIALLERNEFEVGVLEFDDKGRLVEELRFPDPGWLKHERWGGRLSVEAPNRIIVHQRDGTSITSTVHDGRFFGADGSSREVRRSIPIGSPPKSDIESKAEPAVVISSTLWPVVIVVAIGLLCLLLKNRK